MKQVLTFARGFHGERAPVSPEMLVREIAQGVQETFPRNVRVSTEVADDLPLISADAAQLHRVLLNLAVNAFQCSPAPHRVEIAARREGALVRIHVRDFDRAPYGDWLWWEKGSSCTTASGRSSGGCWLLARALIHEAGHAIQHKVGYAMMTFRQTMVPAVQVAAPIAYILCGFAIYLIGSALGGVLLKIAVVALLVMTVFQFVTLPVEFDASRRAKVQLVSLGILDEDEMPGVNQTLDAAALTYVAAFISALLNLLYLLSRRD